MSKDDSHAEDRRESFKIEILFIKTMEQAVEFLNFLKFFCVISSFITGRTGSILLVSLASEKESQSRHINIEIALAIHLFFLLSSSEEYNAVRNKGNTLVERYVSS